MSGHDEKPLARKDTPKDGRKSERNIYSSFCSFNDVHEPKNGVEREVESIPGGSRFNIQSLVKSALRSKTFCLG